MHSKKRYCPQIQLVRISANILKEIKRSIRMIETHGDRENDIYTIKQDNFKGFCNHTSNADGKRVRTYFNKHIGKYSTYSIITRDQILFTRSCNNSDTTDFIHYSFNENDGHELTRELNNYKLKIQNDQIFLFDNNITYDYLNGKIKIPLDDKSLYYYSVKYQ